MIDELPLAADAYALAGKVYASTAKFSERERGSLGEQLRETVIQLATQTTDAVTTDDPAERQEMLRQANVSCLRMRLLLRIAGDMGELAAEMVQDAAARVASVEEGIARERRSVRR